MIAAEASFPWSRVGSALLDPDVEAAITYTAIHTGAELSKFRNEQKSWLQQMVRHPTVVAVQESILTLPNRPAAAEKIPPKYNFALLCLMIDAMKWPDIYLPYKMYSGFETSGTIADSGVFRPVPVREDDDTFQQRCSDSQAPDACEQWLHDLTLRLRTSGTRAQRAGGPELTKLQKVEEVTLDEVRKGLCSKQLSLSDVTERVRAGGTRPSPRFGVKQGDKIRPIDDCTRCGINSITQTVETVTHPNAEFPAKVAKKLLEACAAHGKVMPEIGVAFDDCDAAYRLIPSSRPGNSIVAFWSPSQQQVVFYQVWGHSFGLVSAVLNFNRVPHMHAAFMRRYFAAIIDHYVDDYIMVDKLAAKLSLQAALAKLHALTGTRLALGTHGSKNKRKALCSVQQGLGVVFDMSQAHTAQALVSIRPTAERCGKILATLRKCRVADSLSPKQAQILAGKLQFTTSAIHAKAGRAATQPLYHSSLMAHHLPQTFTPAMLAMEHFLRILLTNPPQRTFQLRDKRLQKHVVAYSDATGHGNVGVVIIDTELNTKCVAAGQCQQWLEDDVCYVNQYELLAILCLDLTFEHSLSRRQIYHFVDNTTALSTMVHGYSGKPEMAKLASMVTLVTIRAGFDTFFEYVDTNANVADAPSRPGDPKVKEGARALIAEMAEVPIVFPTREQWADVSLMLSNPHSSAPQRTSCKRQRGLET